MKTIVLAATKGGVGKTTLSTALAVRATADRKRVALIDLDPQKSLTEWWARRGEPVNPYLHDDDMLTEAVASLDAEGFDWLFIDTPPAFVDTINDAIEVADLVLIPTHASFLDITAIAAVAEAADESGKPAVIVLNAVEPRWKLTKSAPEFLNAEGYTVLDEKVVHRQAYVAAVTVGKTGPEVERDGKCTEEIDALWNAVKKHAAKATKAAKVRA